MSDLEIFCKQPLHSLDIVANRHNRETGTVERFRRIARRRGTSVAEEFRRYKEEAGGVESAPRPDQPFIPMEICHVVRWQEDDIVFGGIQMAIRAVHDSSLRQSHSTLGMEIRDGKFVLLGALLFCR